MAVSVWPLSLGEVPRLRAPAKLAPGDSLVELLAWRAIGLPTLPPVSYVVYDSELR